MGARHGWIAFGIVLAVSGCAVTKADKAPLRVTPTNDAAASPVVREVVPQSAMAAAPKQAPPPSPAAAKAELTAAAPILAHASPAPAPPASAPAAAAPAVVPPGTLYVCTATINGQTRQTAIDFEPKVRQLCSKHPEMGVCQYARQACRASGGRVHTAAGVEITRQTEAEYDKKVLRARFRAG